MTEDRVYRTALDREQALVELTAAAGSQLDPRVVAALIEVVRSDTSNSTPIDPRRQRRFLRDDRQAS